MMIWAVGIYEIGMMFFALWCVLAFSRGRAIAAAIALLLSLSFKENAIVVPAILAAMTATRVTTLGRRLRDWLPLTAVVLVYGLAKSMGSSPFALPEDDPYSAALWGEHVFTNLKRYAVWAIQSVVPIESPADGTPTVFLVALLFAAGSLVLRQRSHERVTPILRPIVVFAAWSVVGLLPLLFLQQHAYRYYLNTALPGILAAVSLTAIALLESLRLSPRAVIVTLALATGTVVALSAAHVQSSLNEGRNQRSQVWGTNHLIMRCGLVELAHDELVPRLAHAPKDAIVLLQGFDLTRCAGRERSKYGWMHLHSRSTRRVRCAETPGGNTGSRTVRRCRRSGCSHSVVGANESRRWRSTRCSLADRRNLASPSRCRCRSPAIPVSPLAT